MSATNRGAVRNAQDFYATPAWCTEALRALLAEQCPNIPRAFDPCAGDGAILNVLRAAGWRASGFELDQERAAKAEVQQRDALTHAPWGIEIGDIIITNPPYSLAMEFVQRAVKEAHPRAARVIMLLRLNFLGSQKRAGWLRSYTPSVYVLPRRPSFTGGGTDATEYAWLDWDWTPGKRPTVRILEVA